MSDRIGVMRAGKLVQVGTPNEIYSSPRTEFVSEFMGDVNVIAVKSTGNGSLLAPSLEAKFTAPPARTPDQSGHRSSRRSTSAFSARPTRPPTP